MAKVNLKPTDLYTPCSLGGSYKPEPLTDDLKTSMGQQRAINALNFFINVKSDNYHMYALGPEGTGKNNLIQKIVRAGALEDETPCDWCYVNNFDEPHKPVALALPAGTSVKFAHDMNVMLQDLLVSIPAIFDGEEYRNRLRIIEESFKNQEAEYFSHLQKRTKGQNVSILRMPTGLVVAPVKNGKVLTPEAFEKLSKDEQNSYMADLNTAQEKLEAAVKNIPVWESDKHVRIKKLNDEVADFAVRHSLDAIKRKYKDLPGVQEYLSSLHRDIIENIAVFISPPYENPSDDSMKPKTVDRSVFKRYQVNVFVRRDPMRGAPVVVLDNPSVPNLIGRMERQQHLGSLITEFNLIKPGALHQANGGFLIIKARSIVSKYAFEILKRALLTKKIAIADQEEDSANTIISLSPQPIPLSVRVILVGPPDLYYQLFENDPEFKELFKVEANFTGSMPRNKEEVMNYAGVLSGLSRRAGLRWFSKTALERLIEHSSRLAGDSRKLTAHFGVMDDLMHEADYYARLNNASQVGRTHVQQAIDGREQRDSRMRDKFVDQVKSGVITIETRGTKVGQINGLVVLEFGKFAFGRPSRISCLSRVGSRGIIDIERETKLGGASHTKGVLILSSFLSNRFAANHPLPMDASLTFEQSYNEIDGDSASVTELYAIMSSIGNLPIRQDLAITGSIDQFGNVQAVGSINEKIEGFYDICVMQGLTGTQGVIIPAANKVNLMLRHDVVEAVQKHRFSVYAINTVDDGFELMCGLPAGKMDAKGRWTKGGYNQLIAERVDQLWEKYIDWQRELK